MTITRTSHDKILSAQDVADMLGISEKEAARRMTLEASPLRILAFPMTETDQKIPQLFTTPWLLERSLRLAKAPKRRRRSPGQKTEAERGLPELSINLPWA